MFRSTLVVAVAVLSAVTSAQNYSTSGPLEIDPAGVDLVLRQAWCRAQTESCPDICGGRASPNTCDPETLEYTCTCTDGSSPNITDFDQTLPSFVCAQWIENCVESHPDDLEGITACRSVTCGSRNASEASGSGSSTDSSSAPESSETPSSTNGGSGGATQTTASESGVSPSATDSAAVALHVASNYGTGIVVAGLLAVFGLAL